MAHKCLLFAVTAVLLFGVSCTKSGGGSRDDYYFTEVVFPNGTKVLAEAIRDPITMQRGMMFRETLAPDRGMLFSHGQMGNFPYWMHNVIVPLDIIWLDDKRRVVEIVENAAPCPRKPCRSYGGSKTAMFVLEVNAGVTGKAKLSVGDELKLVGY